MGFVSEDDCENWAWNWTNREFQALKDRAETAEGRVAELETALRNLVRASHAWLAPAGATPNRDYVAAYNLLGPPHKAA